VADQQLIAHATPKTDGAATGGRVGGSAGPGGGGAEVVEEPEVPPAVRTGRAMARLSRLLEQTAGAAGLSLAQYRVLVFVRQEPCRASALADKVDVRRATLSAIVAGLERTGLLARSTAAGDGRGVVLAVTDVGASVLATVEATLHERLSRAAQLGGVDLDALAPYLEALLAGFLAAQEADVHEAEALERAAPERAALERHPQDADTLEAELP